MQSDVILYSDAAVPRFWEMLWQRSDLFFGNIFDLRHVYLRGFDNIAKIWSFAALIRVHRALVAALPPARVEIDRFLSIRVWMNQLKDLIVVYTSILIAQNPTNLLQLNIARSAKRTYSLLYRYFGFCLWIFLLNCVTCLSVVFQVTLKKCCFIIDTYINNGRVVLVE